MKNSQYLLKQCTRLLSYDTSVYTIFAVLSGETKDVREEIHRHNNGRSSELHIEINEGTEVAYHRLLEFIETASTNSDVMFFADTSKYAESILMVLLDLCTK